MPDWITGVVLAGGLSSRLGRDKAQVELAGKTLLQRALEPLQAVCLQVLVVTSAEGLASQVVAATGVRLIPDLEPGRGPLGGLYSGLHAAEGTQVLLVGCDMPFLKPALLEVVIKAAVGRQAAVPRLDGVPQTLHAVYSPGCLPAIEKLMTAGSPGLRDLLSMVDVRYLESEEITPLDPQLLSFFNANTRTELEQARRLLEDTG